MKKVISMVGTSIITNVLEEEEGLYNYYDELKDKSYSDWEYYERKIRKIKDGVLEYLKDDENFEKASAEIESILEISKKYKDENKKVYLLTTDTILSYLSAEIIKTIFEEYVENSDIEIKIHLVKSLNVNENFVEGLNNLIEKIENIAGGYYENLIFNITGGYKGIIPYLTIMAVVNECEIYYIHEESNKLIRIPQIPLKIDYNLFEKYEELIIKLENGIESYQKLKVENYKACEKLEKSGLVEIVDDIAFLSPIGRILFNRYKGQFVYFYATDEIYKDIKNKKEIMRILKSKFFENYNSKTQDKSGHLVYDDGNNQNRIFYFKDGDEIYIYEVFEDHDKYEKYLNSEKFTNEFKESYKNLSKLRRIKKEE
ncbi:MULTISPECIES: putative CRISPR-associated protein [unclassified Thermosipho (in: thermotogales)]|uniref:putative CRISPR-associated protein n=1 Tax=unclassified Thermosipho (in: thermotogales) TaxID=2676525 RepID=UPI0009869896|nr:MULTISPECIES: putative CRISPR-associated protein [unclassified Thermosipho (in: thermotogales)]MBT1247057.1 hypothetical protein [Thermosipho sp. 1244]OOC46911.1 hypothetical protein XO09_04320 [Thermosipho sp. 1223]